VGGKGYRKIEYNPNPYGGKTRDPTQKIKIRINKVIDDKYLDKDG